MIFAIIEYESMIRQKTRTEFYFESFKIIYIVDFIGITIEQITNYILSKRPHINITIVCTETYYVFSSSIGTHQEEERKREGEQL